jgi:hypothetical protein
MSTAKTQKKRKCQKCKDGQMSTSQMPTAQMPTLFSSQRPLPSWQRVLAVDAIDCKPLSLANIRMFIDAAREVRN